MKKKLLLLFAGTAIHLTGFSQALDFTAVEDGMLVSDTPAGIVTTFYAK
jgi:hypothetical protein